jgi:hypothetical protein
MIPRATFTIRQACIAAAVLICTSPAAAANQPLEVTNIKPRTSETGGGRIYRAYPGVAYEIRVAVVGGAFPYTFSLAEAPAGMVIDARTGAISWPSPQGRAAPTVTVVDAEGTRASASWTVDVTTAGFRFIDAVNGRSAEGNGCTANCGTGAFDSPWRSVADMYKGAGEPGQFVYFRAGTYRLDDVPRSRRSIGTPWERVEFEEPQRPVVWLGYPGERPVLDFGYRPGGAAPLVRFVGRNIYIDNLETINSHIIGFQFVAHLTGATIRRVAMRNHGTTGLDGSNASMIMTVTTPEVPKYMVVQDCQFTATQTVAVKIYAQEKLLMEDNVFQDVVAGVALKDDVRHFTLRRNTFRNIPTTAIGGNMHETTTSGEILFNNVLAADIALDVNQDGMAGRIDVYRNTLVGRVRVRNTDEADGPFRFSNNVIVSGDGGKSRIVLEDVSAEQRVVASDNLVGSPSDKLVDASGKLTPRFAKYRGVRGH